MLIYSIVFLISLKNLFLIILGTSSIFSQKRRISCVKQLYFVDIEKQAYFRLDDSIIKEILYQGIGEKKRSIRSTNKPIDKRVLEATKCIRNYITSLDNNSNVPLLQSIQNRFYISKKTAESYLCLLFLLSDNTNDFLEWSLLKVFFSFYFHSQKITWFVLCHWTIGTEYLASEDSADIEVKSISPLSLELSEDFLKAMKEIYTTVEKNIDNRVVYKEDRLSIELDR